jgi:hypothetical protein
MNVVVPWFGAALCRPFGTRVVLFGYPALRAGLQAVPSLRDWFAGSPRRLVLTGKPRSQKRDLGHPLKVWTLQLCSRQPWTLQLYF